MIEKMRKTIRAYEMISPGEKILVAVSGGPDSLALIFLLNSLKKEMRLKLHIGHIDHSLRGDSAADAAFVKKLAEKLGIPVNLEKIRLNKKPAAGWPEEFLRRQRLNFLIKLARDIKADKIALGHNLDDQAETVLMRILRGSGLYGLSGIYPKRRINGFYFIRPLIEIRRREIEAYLKRRNLLPRIDSTNKEDIFLRNRIRHKLLPLLEREYNKNIKESLANLAQCVSADYDWLSLSAKRTLPRYLSRLPISGARRLHRALLRMKIRAAISRVQGDTRRISFRHIKEIEDLLFNRPASSIVNLPKGLKVKKSRNFISFSAEEV